MFTINTLMFIALHAYVVRRLIKPELTPQHDPRGGMMGLIGSLSYLVGAAAAWFSVHAAFVRRLCVDAQQYRRPRR